MELVWSQVLSGGTQVCGNGGWYQHEERVAVDVVVPHTAATALFRVDVDLLQNGHPKTWGIQNVRLSLA